MKSGTRNRQVIFERATVVVDDYGGETPTWETYATVLARYQPGSGQEKREAAQESGQQTATFYTAWSPLLAAVEINDRIVFNGDDWDITETATLGLNEEIRFTATRSA